MKKLSKLKKGDKVAVVSPSFVAPAVWPHVYKLGLKRLQEVFGLEPIEFLATKNGNATKEEKMNDLYNSFETTDIKAVIATLGGNEQVTYVKNLDPKVFVDNPKPFFGFSDNTHFLNFLWLNNIPSYYGASLFTQFAMNTEMDSFTVEYIKHALFDEGKFELKSSEKYNDIILDWNNPENLNLKREYEKNDGWFWDGENSTEGIIWGGCLESIDELLRHNIQIPTLADFSKIVLITETSEEIPSADNVYRVYRALGERGILKNIKAVLVGRPQAWSFDKNQTAEEKSKYKKLQRDTILQVVREYNKTCPVIQNMDFGHTNPQIPIPYGGKVYIDSTNKKIFADF